MPGEEEPPIAASPASRRPSLPKLLVLSPRVAVFSYLFFAAILVGFERGLIRAIADPNTHPPNILWQLLWPTGLIAVGLLLPHYIRWLFLGVMGCISIFILAADAAYFDFFGTVTSMVMYTSMHQLIDVRDSVGNLISIERLLPALLFLPFYFLAAVRFRHRSALKETHPKTTWRKSPQVWGGFLIVINIIVAAVAWHIPIYEETHHVGRDNWVKPSEHWNSRYSRSSYAATFGVFNYHVMDLIGVLRSNFSRDALTAERQTDLKRILAHKKQLNDRKSPLWGSARGRNVIIVQLESLQHFLLNLQVQDHEVMPVLSQLENSSLNWEYIFDVTYVGRTSDAEFATMTGLLPDARKPAAYYSLSNSLVTLPKELKKNGYATASLHGFKRSFWNRAYAHPAYGIDKMHFEERYRGLQHVGLGVADEDLFKYSADLLESSSNQLQFSFIISLSSHHPYVYVDDKYMKPYRHLSREDGYGLIAPYLASASYADEALGSFLQLLKDRDLMENSLLVIYGDHDRGGLGTSKSIPEIGERMYEPMEDRIPLVIAIPGKEELIALHRHEYVGVMGGLHDLAPTILHLLGAEVPYGMMGTHLFVENEYRDPMPIPGTPGLFAYNDALSLPDGQVTRTRFFDKPTEHMPSAEEAMTDQLLVQDLLDHYDTIIQPR